MRSRFSCVQWLGWALGAVCSIAAEPRPNVVLIISDDHGWPDYGFMGHPHVSTPNLDRLAAGGLTFTRGYVTTALCAPSLTSLLTGLYPHQHGITGNDLRAPPDRPEAGGMRGDRRPLIDRLLANTFLLPRALSAAGYRTMQTGKLWNVGYAEIGFTDGMTRPGGRHGGEGLSIGREGLEPIARFVQSAISEQRPFFVWYAPFLPHTPHNPPPRLLQRYTGRGLPPAAQKYYAMVEWLDETCGALDEILKTNGVFESTLVIYLADNGWDAELGDNSRVAKRSPYDLGVRTPVMVRWPARVRPRRDDDSLVSIVDVLPTIAHACGIPTPAGLPGINLLDAEALARRRAIFLENYTVDIIDIARPERSLLSRGVIAGEWKLLVAQPAATMPTGENSNPPREPIELYRIRTDPRETQNLAAQEPDRVRELRALLDAWWAPPTP
ncbi:MAG: sulfatase [Kiritimatiellae bacterium]|nr:sulfatase [Kiritimatiellia bacterium]